MSKNSCPPSPLPTCMFMQTCPSAHMPTHTCTCTCINFCACFQQKQKSVLTSLEYWNDWSTSLNMRTPYRCEILNGYHYTLSHAWTHHPNLKPLHFQYRQQNMHCTQKQNITVISCYYYFYFTLIFIFILIFYYTKQFILSYFFYIYYTK